jgi:hypothetical protein
MRVSSLLTVVLTISLSSRVLAGGVRWNEGAEGQFGSAASWEGGLVPGNDDVALFGAKVGTVESIISVSFLESQQTLGAWIASGDYEFQFGTPAITYVVDDIVVGSGDSEFFAARGYLIPETLPASAALAIRGVGVSAEIEADSIRVGGPPAADETIRHGRFIVEGGGTHLATQRGTVGGLGNSGHVEVIGGATWTSDVDIFVGGGASRPFSGKPIVEVGLGSMRVGGRSDEMNAKPSTVSTGFLEVGSRDSNRDVPLGYSDVQIKVGSVEIYDGGVVNADVVIIGDDDRFGLFANNRAGLDLPIDMISVASGPAANATDVSRLLVRERLTMGIDSVLDLEFEAFDNSDGGFATVGQVDNSNISKMERLYLGSFGRVEGIGTIRGDVEQLDGTMAPGFSPGVLSINGKYEQFGGVVEFEIFGDEPGTGHDQLTVTEDVELGGRLYVSLEDLVLQLGMEFLIIDVGGNKLGGFAGLAQNATVLTDPVSGVDLLIDYFAGDGNDVRLYTRAVPEPTSSATIVVAVGAQLCARRRRIRRND